MLTDAALKVTNAGGDSNGVWGDAGTSSSAGVYGTSTSGYGVFGSTSQGYDLFAGGNGRIGMYEHLGTGAPTSGNYALGDIFRNASGDLWVCVVAGAAPASAKFLKLGGPASAGQTHLTTPERIFDSRPNQTPNNGTGPLSNGSEVTIDLSTKVPDGATGAIVSLLAFGTGSDGFLTAYQDGSAYPGTINAFWGNGGPQTASTTFVRLSAARRFKIRLTQSSGTTSIAVDLFGYFR